MLDNNIQQKTSLSAVETTLTVEALQPAPMRYDKAWADGMMKLPKRAVIELLATKSNQADKYFLWLRMFCTPAKCREYSRNPETTRCNAVDDCPVAKLLYPYR